MEKKKMKELTFRSSDGEAIVLGWRPGDFFRPVEVDDGIEQEVVLEQSGPYDPKPAQPRRTAGRIQA